MHEIEYTEALGRLLTEGPLRDEFTADPAHGVQLLSSDPDVQAALLQLDAKDLEAQAQVLLRKRFVAAKALLPVLHGRLEEIAWPLFLQFARARWGMAEEDASAFASYVLLHPLDHLELRQANILRFVLGPVEGLRSHHLPGQGWQILFRPKQGLWAECVLALGL